MRISEIKKVVQAFSKAYGRKTPVTLDMLERILDDVEKEVIAKEEQQDRIHEQAFNSSMSD